jgi:hypothetical protein
MVAVTWLEIFSNIMGTVEETRSSRMRMLKMRYTVASHTLAIRSRWRTMQINKISLVYCYREEVD